MDRKAFGTSEGIVHDSEMLWSAAYSNESADRKRLVSPRSMFRVGSVTKTLMSVAIMQLIDKVKLGLQDPVAQHLPHESNLWVFRSSILGRCDESSFRD